LKPISRRKWMLGAAAGAAGCGRRRHPPDPNSITVLYPYDEYVLGPGDDMPARQLVFLPLVAWNTRGELEGRLAEGWEHSPDYRTWTIRLRDGIRWHDGTPLTAHDIKFTLELLCHPDILWDRPEAYTVKLLDDLTYSITYHKQIYGGRLLDDWKVYYPKHIVEKLDARQFYNWDFWTHPVGNGPYRHVRTVPHTMMHLEANPEYYRGRPRIANVVLKFGDVTGDGAVPELLSGNVDAATNIRPADLLKLARDDRFGAYGQPLDDWLYALLWNHRHPLFRDAKVRRALTLAINRRELFQACNFPSDTPLLDAPVSARQFRLRQFAAPIPYDPEQAGRLLDEAGWYKRNREGLRERDGKPFRFTAVSGRTLAQDTAAVYIQAQLRRVGVRMEIQTLEDTVQFRRAATGEYEAAINRVETERFLRSAGYASPRYTQLTSRLRTTVAPDQEDQIYREITQLFHEDVPATFLYPDLLTTVVNRRVRGLDRSPNPGDLTWCMDDLYLEGQA
jgi:peptide/nickel transport system substrate-binding protein